MNLLHVTLFKTTYNMRCESNKIRQLECVDIETLFVSQPLCYIPSINISEMS